MLRMEPYTIYILSCILYMTKCEHIINDNVILDSNDHSIHIHISSQEDQVELSGQLGLNIFDNTGLHPEYSEISQGVVISWPGYAHMTISEDVTPSQYDVTCQDVSWEADSCDQTVFEDCYSLSGSSWYGGSATQYLEWPVDKWDVDFLPFISGDSVDDVAQYGGVLEPYWLNSNGYGFFVGYDVPLWVSINDTGNQQLCFRSSFEHPFLNFDETPMFLNYTVCQGSDMMEMHRYAIDTYLGKPDDIPDEILFRYPIYSTWARFKKEVNQSVVLDFAQEINLHNFPKAQIEIDDHWEINYGVLDFDPEKFPDPQAMVTDLQNMGFRTTLWVHPFCDLASEYVWWGGLMFVFMKDPGGILPALTTWWNGVGTTLDFTDPDAVTWWMDHLQALQTNYGISSFKFDAGEANWLPASYVPFASFTNPSEYTRQYAELAYALDPDVRHQEVRAGWRTQHLPIFTRILGKDSQWTYDNGLKSLIPHILLFSVLGYVFPLPDMVGGNAYSSGFPERELYIRWTQVHVFLPVFQFSIVPWQFDQEIIDICRAMLSLHEQYADLMIELGRNATTTGEPIIRPLWWVAPTDPVAQQIDSEYLLGNDVLAAPVLDPGVSVRDIYLPAGRWRDMNDLGTILDGARWYADYPAPLNVLPYFTRVI